MFLLLILVACSLAAANTSHTCLRGWHHIKPYSTLHLFLSDSIDFLIGVGFLSLFNGRKINIWLTKYYIQYIYACDKYNKTKGIKVRRFCLHPLISRQMGYNHSYCHEVSGWPPHTQCITGSLLPGIPSITGSRLPHKSTAAKEQSIACIYWAEEKVKK